MARKRSRWIKVRWNGEAGGEGIEAQVEEAMLVTRHSSHFGVRLREGRVWGSGKGRRENSLNAVLACSDKREEPIRSFGLGSSNNHMIVQQPLRC